MKPEVFLDTGILFAALDRRDGWHAAAARLFLHAHARCATSYFVFAEAYTLLLQRTGEEGARRLTLLLNDLDELEIFEPTHLHHSEVLRMLDGLRGHKLSYVDASSLVFLRRYGIATVWSTDRHLGLTGATVLPRGV